MRIAVLTHHWVGNFGANLQSQSTCNTLMSLGHKVCCLDYRTPSLEEVYKRNVCADQMFVHGQFCRENLPLSPIIRSEGELVEHCNRNKYDLVIVGSDAVFRLHRTRPTAEGPFPNPFWMTWALKLEEKPHIAALAASCTGSMYLMFPSKLKCGIRAALACFDYVSVRDRWTRWMLGAVSHGKCLPNICPDPLFALNDALDTCGHSKRMRSIAEQPYILLSVDRAPDTIGHIWIDRFVEIANNNGFEVYQLPVPEGSQDVAVDWNIPLPLSPLDWYMLIKGAAGVVATRFHPIVCCIANSIPFVSIDNNLKRCLRVPVRLRSKQYDLCKNVGMASHCITLNELKRLGPEAIYAMLRSCSRIKMDHYRLRARTQFHRTVEDILALP